MITISHFHTSSTIAADRRCFIGQRRGMMICCCCWIKSQQQPLIAALQPLDFPQHLANDDIDVQGNLHFDCSYFVPLLSAAVEKLQSLLSLSNTISTKTQGKFIQTFFPILHQTFSTQSLVVIQVQTIQKTRVQQIFKTYLALLGPWALCLWFAVNYSTALFIRKMYHILAYKIGCT